MNHPNGFAILSSSSPENIFLPFGVGTSFPLCRLILNWKIYKYEKHAYTVYFLYYVNGPEALFFPRSQLLHTRITTNQPYTDPHASVLGYVKSCLLIGRAVSCYFADFPRRVSVATDIWIDTRSSPLVPFLTPSYLQANIKLSYNAVVSVTLSPEKRPTRFPFVLVI